MFYSGVILQLPKIHTRAQTGHALMKRWQSEGEAHVEMLPLNNESNIYIFFDYKKIHLKIKSQTVKNKRQYKS